MNETHDYANYITINNVRRSDGYLFSKESFAGCEDYLVPLVWNNMLHDPTGCLGHCTLENRDEGVYAKCWFNDSENAQITKKMLTEASDVGISFSANRIKYGEKGHILSGVIRAVHVTPRDAMFTYDFKNREKES